MASSSSHPYQQHGVFFPCPRPNPNANPPITSEEWPALPPFAAAAAATAAAARVARPSPKKKRRIADNDLHMAEKGFLLVKILAEPAVLLVQSETDGKLYILKISQPGADLEEDEDDAEFYEDPLELRVSTWVNAPGVLPDDAPFFNQLRFWQRLTVEGSDPVYALYFDFCNGGTVEELIDKYYALNTPVPEHFIWLVAEQLSLAIAWLRYGIRPDRDNVGVNDMNEDWLFRHHRDLAARNVFINYLAFSRGRPSAAGYETNALPQIVLGDFGNAGIQGDDPAALPGNIVDHGDLAPALKGWEDVYTLGRILRSLCMAHVPFADGGNDHWSSRPNNTTLAAANTHVNAVPPYSAELIGLLQNFEWPGMVDGEIGDVEDPENDIQANERWVVETLLPAAQARVAGYRNPGNAAAGGGGGGRPEGYFDALSVAWTKPPTPGVFAYNPRYAEEAGDGATGARPGAAVEMGAVERMDRGAHRQLLRLGQRWQDVMPYETRVVEFPAPVVADEAFPDAP